MDQATETDILKHRVVETLGKLNSAEIQNVLKFSEFLLFEGRKKVSTPLKHPDPKNDPIFDVIGIAEVEPFAHEIDRELYGD
jgi:glutamine synthetase